LGQVILVTINYRLGILGFLADGVNFNGISPLPSFFTSIFCFLSIARPMSPRLYVRGMGKVPFLCLRFAYLR